MRLKLWPYSAYFFKCWIPCISFFQLVLSAPDSWLFRYYPALCCICEATLIRLNINFVPVDPVKTLVFTTALKGLQRFHYYFNR
jgi:hypothetical protein